MENLGNRTNWIQGSKRSKHKYLAKIAKHPKKKHN